MISLKDRIHDVDGSFTTANELWVRFVKDHVRWLKKRSNYETLDSTKRIAYRYRLSELVNSYDISDEDVWIVAYINDMDPTVGIPSYQYVLLVPSTKLLGRLKSMYESYVSALRKTSR